MGMTMAEKILAKASGRSAVKAGEYVTAAIGVAMTQESMKSI
jgi:homoaconitase/3-isopropylmalate dehydratase large subunit